MVKELRSRICHCDLRSGQRRSRNPILNCRSPQVSGGRRGNAHLLTLRCSVSFSNEKRMGSTCPRFSLLEISLPYPATRKLVFLRRDGKQRVMCAITIQCISFGFIFYFALFFDILNLFPIGCFHVKL